MPIAVWRPTFHHARVDGITHLHLLACEKSDLLGVDGQRLRPAWMLRNDDLGAALVELCDNRVAVEGLVGY